MMFKLNTPFKEGIGKRLIEERKRNGLSQALIADKTGINKMTQLKYEKEISLPNLKYLSAAIPLGIDIHYVLFGIYSDESSYSESDVNEIEKKALSLLHKNEAEIGNMDDNKRHVMFKLLKSQLLLAQTDKTLEESLSNGKR